MIFAFKSASFARPHLWFFASKTATLAPELQVSIGLILHLWFCAFKSASFAAKILVSMDPSPPLWFLHAKLRLYDQNYKSLLVPHLIYCFFAFKTASLAPDLQVYMSPSPHLLFFCIHNSVIMTRINSLYGSQTSPVVVYMQNNEINTRITSLYGSQPSSVVFACKTATL